jgi:hypothetical protein
VPQPTHPRAVCSFGARVGHYGEGSPMRNKGRRAWRGIVRQAHKKFRIYSMPAGCIVGTKSRAGFMRRHRNSMTVST